MVVSGRSSRGMEGSTNVWRGSRPLGGVLVSVLISVYIVTFCYEVKSRYFRAECPCRWAASVVGDDSHDPGRVWAGGGGPGSGASTRVRHPKSTSLFR